MIETIRVHELAKELRKSNREVTDRLRKLEIPWKTNLSSITQEDANRVRVSFGRDPVKLEKPKKPARKPAAKKPARKPASGKAEKKPAAKKPAGKAPAKKAPAKKAAAGKEAAVKAEKKPAAKKPAAGKAAAKTIRPVDSKASASRAVVAEAAPAVVEAKQAEVPEVKIAPVMERPAKPAAGHVDVVERKPVKAPARPAEPGKVAAPPPAQVKQAPQAKPPSAHEKQVPQAKPPLHKEVRRGLAAVVPVKPPLVQKPADKPTLRVAPTDRRAVPERRSTGKKVYRFVPKGRRRAPSPKGPPSTVAPKMLRVPAGVTVKEFAQKAGLTAADVMKKMIGFGEMITVNQPISDAAIKLLSEDLGIEIKVKASRIEELEDLDDIVESPEDLEVKPPVVTVMGHVDHGKTLLLDAIRKTDVVSQEMGGITQHIGAYQVAFSGKPITFIDTPGHESFTAMRARGAQITDIAVLVVAADDGVMPQTLEALDHAIEAEVPVIVAVNKIDKPGSDTHRVRQQLSEKGLIPEDWGGETVFVDVSAMEGTNIDHLLEMILLVAELQELRVNPHAQAGGVVVEAKLDKARGPVATVLVRRGTASIGDVFVVGPAWGKIRAMFNDRGEVLTRAIPSQPVEILGLSGMPMAGDEFRVVEDEKKARQIADRLRMTRKLEEQAGTPRHVSLENFLDLIKEDEAKELKVVLKADAQGSLEAVAGSLEKLPQEEVKLRIIHSGVGGITETDIMLASASDAIVLGFNVRPDSKASRVAEAEEVDVRTYQIIYKLTEDVEAALVGMLAPLFEEEVEGRAEVRQTFRVPGMGMVGGSYILEGEITRNSLVRLVRDGVVIHDGKIGSLRRFKEDVRSVAGGFECGIGLEGYQDIKDGDILEAYRMKEVARTSIRTSEAQGGKAERAGGITAPEED